MSTGLSEINESGDTLVENETMSIVWKKIRTCQSKLQSLRYWIDSEKEKKMRSIEKYRSQVDALSSQIYEEDIRREWEYLKQPHQKEGSNQLKAEVRIDRSAL